MVEPEAEGPVLTETMGMDIESVEISTLVFDDRNTRVSEVGSIVESLREFGQHRAAVCQRSTRKILVGNHMVKAALALGWTHIVVWWKDDDDTTAIRRGIADNATGDQASWDEAGLMTLLKEVGTDVPGVDDGLLARLAKSLEKDGPQPKPPTYPIVARPGEQYSYVVIFATTIVDVGWMESAFELGKEQSYKSQAAGPTKVLSVKQLRALLPKLASDATIGTPEVDDVLG